jgi:hypothetical protein
MSSDKEGMTFWVRNDVNGDVAGPFNSTQMSEHLKKLPKDKYPYYKVKSSKWNEWKPLVSVIKDKKGGPPALPGKAAPPATPKATSKVPVGEDKKDAGAVSKLKNLFKSSPKEKPSDSEEDMEISSTGAETGFWKAEEEPKSDSGILETPTSSSLPQKQLKVGEPDRPAEPDDAFSDALASAENMSLESSLNLEKAKLTNSRQYPRFELDVEVTFIGTGGENFITKTADLSLGGMRFKDPVPMNLFEESALVSLFYRPARQRFSANLMPVGDAKGFATRAFFNYLSPKNLELLHEWLKMGEAKALPDQRLVALKKKKSG